MHNVLPPDGVLCVKLVAQSTVLHLRVMLRAEFLQIVVYENAFLCNVLPLDGVFRIILVARRTVF